MSQSQTQAQAKTFSTQDIAYMQQAIELAKQGKYSTKPNPSVGCVLVKDGVVIGQGWHHKAGLPHAERVALADAKARGNEVSGATAYVTLEPCSHYGRTPPCALGLVEAKISRCVVAMLDPNPLVSGNGVKLLQEAGIEVAFGCLEQEAEAINVAFLYAMRTQTPYVRVKMGMSVDGRTAMASGESQWITGAEAREEVHRLRAESAAILTGIGTVQHDNPSLTARLSEQELSDFHLTELDAQPLRVVLDAELNIQLEAKLLTQLGRTIVVTSNDLLNTAKAEQLNAMENVQVFAVESDAGRLNLTQVLQHLFTHEKIISVLVEAGAELAGAFVRENLVNEIHLFTAPVLLGSSARPLFALPEIERMQDKIQFSFASVDQFGQDIRLILTPSTNR